MHVFDLFAQLTIGINVEIIILWLPDCSLAPYHAAYSMQRSRRGLLFASLTHLSLHSEAGHPSHTNPDSKQPLSRPPTCHPVHREHYFGNSASFFSASSSALVMRSRALGGMVPSRAFLRRDSTLMPW